MRKADRESGPPYHYDIQTIQGFKTQIQVGPFYYQDKLVPVYHVSIEVLIMAKFKIVMVETVTYEPIEIEADTVEEAQGKACEAMLDLNWAIPAVAESEIEYRPA